MEDTFVATVAVVRCPKQAWFVASKGRSAGYFRRLHASQADIPHVAADNLALNVRTQFSSIKPLYYGPTSWRKGIIYFFQSITLLTASVSAQQDQEKLQCTK